MQKDKNNNVYTIQFLVGQQMKQHVLHSVHIDTFWGVAKKVIEGHIPIFDFLSVQYEITTKERVKT